MRKRRRETADLCDADVAAVAVVAVAVPVAIVIVIFHEKTSLPTNS